MSTGAIIAVVSAFLALGAFLGFGCWLNRHEGKGAG
jgi:hypothetical protein